MKRLVLGSIYKSKPDDEGNPQPDYVKLRGDKKADFLKLIAQMDDKKGLSLKLESKAKQLEGVARAEANGKLKPEWAVQARERIEKIPDYVRFEMAIYVDGE